VICDIYPPNLKRASKRWEIPTRSRRLSPVLDRKDIEVFYRNPLPPARPNGAGCAERWQARVRGEGDGQTEGNPEGDGPQRPANQVFQVGLQRRYSTIYQAMQMIHSGALGKCSTSVRSGTEWQLENSSPDPKFERLLNWRVYREYSGGLMAELGSHQVDIADWAFQSEPVSVVGVGGLDYWKDGRDIFDNVSVIFEYPEGQKFVFTSICNNAHLDFSEVIRATKEPSRLRWQQQRQAMLFRERTSPRMPHEQSQGH
jgi:hypothetical protein